MATVQTPKAPRVKKDPIALVQRIHSQLTTGVLKSKLSAEDLDLLEKHISKLKAILA